jgi:hypothetical protein
MPSETEGREPGWSSGALRFLLGLTLLLAAPGCAREFYAPRGAIVASPWLNARAARLLTGPKAEVHVEILVTAVSGVRLRNALLSDGGPPPCTSGATFRSLALDGVPARSGPLPLGGAHRLDIVFHDEPPFRLLETKGAVDLDLEHEGGHGCVRVSILGEPAASAWEPVDAPRFAMGAEVESYPFRYRDHGRVTPIGGAGFWFGVEDAKHRAFILQTAAFTSQPTSRASGHLALTLGVARTLIATGPLSAKISAGYQADGYFARETQEQRATRHFVHGPLLAPQVSLALPSGVHAASARGGTLSLELGAPTLVWFGAPGARGVTLLGGLTFGCFGVF